VQHQQHAQQPQHRADQQSQQQQHYDMPKTYSNQNLGAVTMANNTNMASAQQRSALDTGNNSAVPPPPGFTGPPSNIPAATALFQPNLSSLFQMPGAYAPNLSQFPLMFNSPQHKLPAAMFQQTMDESDAQKLYSQQNVQKMYQGQDKFGGAKDRGLNNIGAQPTPPPQMAANNFAYSGGMNMGQHGMGQHKKNPYWNA